VASTNPAGGDFDFRLNVLPGDASQDGKVDGNDFTVSTNNWGKPSGATWRQADFSGGEKVDRGDWNLP
jgi:hypothetical protein